MKKSILILLLVIFSVSCEDLDFIQEEPQSELALTDIDENSVEATILGAYEPLTRSRGRLWESFYATYLNQMTEYTYSRLDQFNNVALYNLQTFDVGFNNSMWTTFYEAIGRANFIIDNLSTNTVLSQDVIDTAVAEASFIRAICYYHLVRTWGEVPLRTVPVANADEVAIPVSSEDAIYDQIIADLMNAESFLPERVVGNEGRATMGAAMLALADVYLTLGNFELARTKAAQVIDNRAVFGYNLITSLDLLYSPSSATNEEEVFALKFAQVDAQGTFITSYSADARGIAAGLAGGGNAFLHTYDDIPLIADWDVLDQRRDFNLYDEIVIDGETLPANIPAPAVDPDARGEGDFFYGKYQDGGALTSTAAGNDFYLYRYADALLIFAEAENQVNGPTAAAYDAINQIRRRGYGVDINTTSPIADFPGGLSQQDFDDLLFQERGYEFFWECKRWFDLKRTGRWEQIAVEAGKPLPTDQFWPLPSIERDNNTEIGE